MTKLRFGSAKEAGLDAARIELVRQRAAEWVASGKHQCIVLLVARHGIVCLHEAWGKLRPGPDSPPARPDSIFWIASNSKPVTAAAVLLLVEDGLLSLNRPVVNYVPELNGAGIGDVTVRHLLTHTAGFANDDVVQGFIHEHFDADPRPVDRTERYIAAGFGLSPTQRPGSTMNYCNYHYALLGEIVRRASGRPFWDFVAQRIFEPLGMNDSWYRYDERFKERMVHLDPAVPFDVGVVIDDAFERMLFDSWNGAYGLKSTAHDYAAFIQMILNNGVYGSARVLGARTVAEMTRNQIPGVGTDFLGTWHPEASWGLGVRVLTNDRWKWFDGSLTPVGTLSHGGAGGTEWWGDPTHDLIGVYFSVCRDIDYERREMHMNFDAVQDMVSAAIVV